MKKKIVLFDVDGTLIDSYEGIINALYHTTKILGYNVDKTTHKLFIGPPLDYSFRKYLNMKEEDISKAIEIYRQYYLEKGRFEYKLYNGVVEVLDELHKRGKIVATATSKPEYMAKKMFDYEKIDDKFDHIFGTINKSDTKLDILKRAIEICGDTDIANYVLIGDTIFDLEATKELGMDCILVKYGYGQEEIFNKVKYAVEKIEDILDVIE